MSLSEVVMVRLSPEDKERVEGHSKAQRRKASEWIRLVVVDHLDELDRNSAKERKRKKNAS